MVRVGCSAVILLALVWPAAAEMAVWGEAALSHDRAYVQETLIYTVRIYSSGNLRRVAIKPPQHPGIAMERLDGPRTDVEELSGKRYVRSVFRYALTPLVSGSLTLGSAQIAVEPHADHDTGANLAGALVVPGRASTEGKPLELTTEPLYLVVLPPFRDVLPWLPLRSLELKARWSVTHVPRAGEPVHLTLDITAAGTLGSRLPSLASYLRPDDLSVYPGEVKTGWGMAEEGDELIGQRTEVYTLVPTREGELIVPALRVSWWDAVSNRRAVAELPAQTLRVGAADAQRETAGPEAMDTAEQIPRLSWRRVWLHVVLPVGGGLVFALMAGWWIVNERSGARLGGRAPSVARHGPLETVSQPRLQATPKGRRTPPGEVLPGHPIPGTRVAPSQTVRCRQTNSLRLRVALLWLRWRVVWQGDTGRLDRLLRRFAAAHLGLPANAPLKRVAEGLGASPLGLDSRVLVALFECLDGARYGRQAIALARWKRDLSRSLGSVWVRPPPHTPLPQGGGCRRPGHP